LNECAKELPDRYRSLKSIDAFRDGNNAESWIWNTFNRKIAQEPTLFMLAQDVIASIREYLQIDSLVNP
jgi:hypothetical protein